MKLLVLAPINSIHTVRWVNSLVSHVDNLIVVSMHDIVEKIDDRIIFRKLPYSAPYGYLANFVILKGIIIEEAPDIIHTHYMSGYGTLSALSVNKYKHAHLLSMWGSDIYDFPKKSFLHKILIRWVADKATYLASTSHVMKDQFYKVYPKYKNPVEVTPFGVDTELFCPNLKDKNKEVFHIGIAKNIEDKYGIKYLIEGFAVFNKKRPNSELHIIGSGSKLNKLKQQAKSIGIDKKIKFYGKIDNCDLPNYLNSWNVCVIPSESESFGVSAVEASSCGLPVVVSNVGGLPEVVEKGVTGLIIPPKCPEAITKSLETLFLDRGLRKKMGIAGRNLVLERYNWEDNVNHMAAIYKKMIDL